MIDPISRQSLVDKLRKRITKASSNVTTKVEATKGDFKIVIAEDEISQFYQNNKVGSVKVAELSNEEVGHINDNPHEFAHDALEIFSSSFDVNEFVKTAANPALDQQIPQKITEKQLSDNNVDLHPRTNSYSTKVTQKQLPEAGQRPGTYDITTEGQLRDERNTFYGVARVSGDWRNEDRNVITEGQFNESASEYSEVANNERGSMGSKYDGGLPKQHQQIGEKQLAELLRHHQWEEPLTTTEDQLNDQSGELSRLNAAAAEKIIKESLNAMSKTVLAAGVTPDNLVSVCKQLLSHPSKHPVLAQTINFYKGAKTDVIDQKVADAQYFGKNANVSRNYNNIELIAADVLVRQLSKLAYNSQYIVDGLIALSNDNNIVTRINESVNNIMTNKTNVKSAKNNIDVFKQVIAGEHEKDAVEGSADNDGLYSYKGLITEVNASISDKKNFVKTATEHAKNKVLKAIGKNINLEAHQIDVNEEAGEFELVFKDKNFNTASNKVASTNVDLSERSAKRRKLAESALKREAQVGGAGGMPPTAGPEMGNPAPPPGGGDMGAPPPAESLTQEPPMGDPALEETSGEPTPPGTTCPVCQSKDVDLDNGEMRCNNCGGETEISVNMNIKKYPTVIQQKEKGEDEEGFGLGAQEEMDSQSTTPAGTVPPSLPAAASIKNLLTKLAKRRPKTYASRTKITPRILEKLSECNMRPGAVCPNCGSCKTDTMKSANKKGENGVCYDCGQEYRFKVKSSKRRKNKVYAYSYWTPKTKTASECTSCNRLKSAFVNSLKNYGITWDQFDNVKSMKQQGNLILKMAKAGSLDIHSAMNSKLPLKKIAASQKWNDYERFDKFPITSCIERISRKFGENATSMSGPCEGKKLANCVCNQLQNLGIYSDGLAAKVASAQGSQDPMEHSPMKTCIAMFVKENYAVDEACTICDGLRAAYASVDDLVVEAINQMSPKPMSQMPRHKPMPKPMSKPMPKPMSNPMSKPMPDHGDSDMDMNDSGPSLEDDMSQGMEDDMDSGMDMNSDMDSDMGMDSGDSDPLNVPIENNDNQEIDINMEGDFDDEFDMSFEGDFDDSDLEFGQDEITISLPQEAVNAIEVLFDALKGQVGDEFIDNTEENMPMLEDDSSLNMDEVTDEVVDSEEMPEDNMSLDMSEDTSDDMSPDMSEEMNDTSEDTSEPEMGEDDSDSDIPGLSDDSDEELVKEGNPEKAMKHNNDNESEDNDSDSESEDNDDVTQANALQQLLYSMKSGSIKSNNSALDNVFSGLVNQVKKAKTENDSTKKVEYKNVTEKKLTVKPTQDHSEIGKYKDNGKMGGEEKFSANEPDVPRGKATLGDESDENTINDKSDLPSIPNSSKLMEGEEHYEPEKGNVVDGNQGGRKASAKKWVVTANHKHYKALMKKAQQGEKRIKLADGKVYDINVKNKMITLVANEKTVSPKKVDSLVNDPDLNKSTGAGKGKTHGDTTHSLGVDEKKPSEGMSSPDVPRAKNKGQLSREHTYDNELSGPTIPAGGGSNSELDQNENYSPEKLDELLGRDKAVAASKEHKEKAVKIAGQMLKSNMISIDELPNKVAELSSSNSKVLDDIQELIKQASSPKGLRKTASTDSVETPIIQNVDKDETNSNLKNQVQTLFKLEQRNKDFERYAQEKGDVRLWR